MGASASSTCGGAVNILLQIMGYATLTDNNARKTDFGQTILILTTNMGARESQNRAIGFEQKTTFEDKSTKAIERAFSPEFRNRLTATVQFGALPMPVVEQVVEKMVQELEVRRKKQNISSGGLLIVAQTDKMPGPGRIFGDGIGKSLTVLLGREHVVFAMTFGAMVFSTFVFDTLDVSMRLARYIIQELPTSHVRRQLHSRTTGTCT